VLQLRCGCQKAGFEGGKTYECAKHVVEKGAPELVEAMDRGEVATRMTFTALPITSAGRISPFGPLDI
jgi:hypothetical protein